MDFFDNAVNKAKEVFDVAYKKTNEVVNTQKQKFDVSSEENKRAKLYERLGEIYFESLKDAENLEGEIKDLTDEIKEKNEKIKALKEEIYNAKNKRICPNCSANIESNSVFCNKCGAKLEFESENE